MRTTKNSSKPRRMWWQPFAFIIALLLLMWAMRPFRPIIHPLNMVRSLATRGETIPTNSALAKAPDIVPQGKNDASKPVPKAVAKESSLASGTSGHYRQVLFTQLSGYQFHVTDDLLTPSADPSEANQKVREQIPDSIWKLSDKDISLTGYMLPVQLKDGLATDFMLLPNQMSCCYGVKPRINEWVIVHTSGKGIKPVMDILVTAQGTFHVGAQRENGGLTGIYELDLDQLKTAND